MNNGRISSLMIRVAQQSHDIIFTVASVFVGCPHIFHNIFRLNHSYTCTCWIP